MTDPQAPTTEAGRALVNEPEWSDKEHRRAIALAIEAEARADLLHRVELLTADLEAERQHVADARAAALAEAAERVELLVAEAGGRCVKPDDYDPGEMNICEAHSELMFDGECEDQPRDLLAVLDILKEIE